MKTTHVYVICLLFNSGPLAPAQDPSAPETTNLLPESVAKGYAKSVRTYFECLDREEFTKANKSLQEFTKDLQKAAKSMKVDSLLSRVTDWRKILLDGGIPEKPELKLANFARGEFRMIDLGESPILINATEKELQGVFDKKYKAIVSLPQDYTKESYPVLLVLHEILEETNKPLKEMEKSKDMLERVDQWARQEYGPEFLASCIVLVPVMDCVIVGSSGLTASRPKWESVEGKTWCLKALSAVVLTAANHDPSRIFIDGHGLGSIAAMQLCALYPSLQTGAIVRGPAPDKIRFENCAGLPILFVGAQIKDFVDAWKHRPGFDKLRQMDSLDLVTLRQWLTDNSKNYCPDKIEIHTDNLAFGSAFWASITDIDVANDKIPLANLIAEADRTSNTITVTTNAKVRGFTIYLNDRILDLSKEVKIINKHDGDTEGTVRFQGMRERSLADMLDFGYRGVHGNTGEIFVTCVSIEIPRSVISKKPGGS